MARRKKPKNEPQPHPIYKRIMLTPVTWNDPTLSEKPLQNFNLRLDPVTHAKIKWLVDNGIGESMQDLCLTILKPNVDDYIQKLQHMMSIVQEEIKERAEKTL